ncbi:MAG TPA: hypothetical protein VGR28_00765 [Candidatus Thermoplasmatota archaeon]|nr:hypothetical protein [Candidatus Thermoplasmatota archaeon]
MDTSITQTIFFIAAVLLATATVAMTYNAVQGMAGDMETHADLLGQRLRSEVRVINDPLNVDVSPDLVLLVKNIGEQTLHPSLWTVLHDGTAYATFTVDVLDSANDDDLRQSETASIAVTGLAPAAGDHAAKIVAETGVSDEMDYTV